MGLSSCSDFLERPGETVYEDAYYWTQEDNFRLYFNYYYTNYFTGYNSTWGVVYTPLRGYSYYDDVVVASKQYDFTSVIPDENGSYSLSSWNSIYGGANWNFSWVRKTNLIIQRLNQHKDELGDEVYNHWMGIARFFRAFEYHRLVTTFGDVPWYDEPVDETDLDAMYKDRDPRSTITDHIYDDLKYALENVRKDDGSMMVNRDVVAAVASNILLFQGTWQYYHKNNPNEKSGNLSDANAQKYLQLCMEAAAIVKDSGKYSCSRAFNTLFGSDDLAGHPEVIFYRHYESGLTTHCIASYSNGAETLSYNPNLDFMRSVICTDGKPYKVSDLPNADSFRMEDLIATRDPRLESSFLPFSWKNSKSYAYQNKFISREGQSYYDDNANRPTIYGSSVNTNDYPCLRLAEVLLNWIEAKAVLAEMGGSAVTQADVDATINVIRDRPLDEEAIERGVQQTAHLDIANIANDPDRDSDVSPLMWEIRRERRIEFLHEGQRQHDLRRWYKLDYMDNVKNPDTMLGVWVDFPNEWPELLNDAGKGIVGVEHADGTRVMWDGTNAAEMVGYAIPENSSKRDDFTDRVYLSPVGTDVINAYTAKGYSITQTGGW